MSTIRFRIIPPIDRPGEPVVITGNVPALGNWDPGRALRLAWQPPFHSGDIEAETGTHLEYKILRGSWENEAVDAYGHIPANCTHEVWLDATVTRTVADWKDRCRGRLTRERLHSRVLAGERDLLVWLPPSYPSSGGHRYPVIVLHDGANVFDPATSPLSHADWAADEWVCLLSGQGLLPEAIVVGVCHPDGFTDENVTQRDFGLSPQYGGAGYAQFVTAELVPHLDTHYRTVAQPGSRLLGGAGLGATQTLFCALHFPGIFGSFVGLSTVFEPGLLETLARLPGLPEGTRFYFDHGTEGTDKATGPDHETLRSTLLARRWCEGRDFLIREIPHARPDEISWRTRFGDALRFLAT
jgi:hypothetical protein